MSRRKSSYSARRVVQDVAQDKFLMRRLGLSRDIERKYLNQSINQLFESYMVLIHRFGEIHRLAQSSTDISKELFDEASRIVTEAFYISNLLSKQGKGIVSSSEPFHKFRKDHENDNLSALMDKLDELRYDLKIAVLRFAAPHYELRIRLDSLFAIWAIEALILEYNRLIIERHEGRELRSRHMKPTK